MNTSTTELAEVIRLLSIWNTQAALALPPPSRRNRPDRLVVPACTVYTPGSRVRPTRSAKSSTVPGPSEARLLRAVVSSAWACMALGVPAVVPACTRPPTCESDTATPGVELKPVMALAPPLCQTPTWPPITLGDTLVTVLAPSTVKLARSDPKRGAAWAAKGEQSAASRPSLWGQ